MLILATGHQSFFDVTKGSTMKKLILTVVVVCIIAFTLTSCAKKSHVYYGEDQFSMKESPGVAEFQNLDLKAEGFAKVTGTAEVPPFPIDDPNTLSFYPVSSEGHVSTSPFYLHQLPQIKNDDGSGTRKAIAWWRPNHAGIYKVQFKVTDTGGLSDTEDVTITVLQSTNTPPILFAKYVMGKK